MQNTGEPPLRLNGLLAAGFISAILLNWVLTRINQDDILCDRIETNPNTRKRTMTRKQLETEYTNAVAKMNSANTIEAFESASAVVASLRDQARIVPVIVIAKVRLPQLRPA